MHEINAKEQALMNRNEFNFEQSLKGLCDIDRWK